MKQNIDGHNKSTLQSHIRIRTSLKSCNCRKPSDCPMAGNYLKGSIAYQATVTTEDSKPNQTYVRLTENAFKIRYANHKASLNNPNKRTSTELSKHIWNPKDTNTNFQTILNRLPLLTPLLTDATCAYGKNILLLANLVRLH